ncbi:hypothetical protein P171DRAFT_445969 [Karstenula rhodostoma CBS 690.94]|uniref:Uncharacterized protein n=1 Tax=Karstenula rhodostoma CBS 690.94 TaxID=1392251 RepID=A0A9P4PFJ8_9PLEO|nr:hypothetical protein P171DRAFT_445969 [Karstenula rhodostoma CBS 690.94]
MQGSLSIRARIRSSPPKSARFQLTGRSCWLCTSNASVRVLHSLSEIAYLRSDTSLNNGCITLHRHAALFSFSALLLPNSRAPPQASLFSMSDKVTSIPGLGVRTYPGPTFSTPDPCWYSESVVFCALTTSTTVQPSTLSLLSASTIPALATLSTSIYGPVSMTEAPAAPPKGSAGPVNVERPSAGCDGIKVNSTCVLWQYWLDMYNEAFPPSGHPKPQPGILFQTPDLDIRGPSSGCNGFVINNFCLRMADVLATLEDRPTNTSAALATATARDPALAPPPLKPTSSPKLGFIAIPIVVILVAVLSGYFFWRRRALKKASSTAARPQPPSPNPIGDIARLYGPPSPTVEQDPRASLYGESSQGGRYLWNGVKIFDSRHARKERERERDIAMRSVGVEQGPSVAARKEWWDKDLLI